MEMTGYQDINALEKSVSAREREGEGGRNREG